METEMRRDEIEIDLRGLFQAIISRFAIIILVGVLVGGLSYAYSKFIVVPTYTSTTQVYIVTRTTSANTLTSSDLVFASNIAVDYQILLTSEPVLSEVKKELNLSMPTSALAGMISINPVKESRVMDISVRSTDPKMAKAIADKVRDVANEKTKNVMGGVQAISAVDEATLPTSPTSPNISTNTLVGFLFGAFITILIIIIRFVLDDTIKTPEDVEARLGLSVLASIPYKSKSASSRRRKKAPEEGAVENTEAASDEETPEGEETAEGEDKKADGKDNKEETVADGKTARNK